MGVDIRNYIVLGYKMPCYVDYQGGKVDLFEEFYDWPFITDPHGDVQFSIIGDGMNGKYLVFGKIISVSNPDEGEGIRFFQYDPRNFEELSKAIRKKFAELFGKYFAEDPTLTEESDEDCRKRMITCPNLLVFSHYT